MAHILILDNDSLSQKVLGSILRENAHNPIFIEDEDSFFDNWNFLLKIDAIVSDVTHWILLRRLKKHPILRHLPIIIYTQSRQKEHVREAIRLKIQAYRIKPYDEEVLLDEISQATKRPWRECFFEDRGIVCERLAISIEEYWVRLEQLANEYATSDDYLSLIEMSNAIGFLVGERMVREQWVEVMQQAKKEVLMKDVLMMMSHYLGAYCNYMKYLSFNNMRGNREIRVQSDDYQSLLVDTYSIENRIKSLGSLPIAEGHAAILRMAIRGLEIDLESVYGLIKKDGAILFQIIAYAQKKFPKQALSDPYMMVQFLGQKGLRECMDEWLIVPEKKIDWLSLQMKKWFRHGYLCACLSKRLAIVFGLKDLAEYVYGCGLMSNIGQLVMSYLYPDSVHQVGVWVRDKGMSDLEAQSFIFGGSYYSLGAIFGKKYPLQGLWKEWVMHGHDPLGASSEYQSVLLISHLANTIINFYEKQHKDVSFILNDYPYWSILKNKIAKEYSIREISTIIHSTLFMNEDHGSYIHV